MNRLWVALILLFTQVSTLHAPVTALAVDGERLLLGQGALLVEAAISPATLAITRSLDLKRGAIRAIIPFKGGLLILSEDGLTALDAANSVLEYVPGGGQRLALRGSRVYVAALAAGIRIYTFDGSKFKLAGRIAAITAEDMAAEGANGLWVAEGDQGVRLYDLTDPAKPIVRFWSANVKPAHLVRVSGARLFLGYADKLALLDTTTLKAPRLLSEITLSGEMPSVADLIVQRSSVLVGRVDQSGADVLLVDLTNPKAMKISAQVGSGGLGERIGLHGNDEVFVGSERGGLQRVQLMGGALQVSTTWEVSAADKSCVDLTPLNPQPANLAAIPPTESLTLKWSAACPTSHYEVQINGQSVGSVDKPEYTLAPGTDAIRWQVIALSESGAVAGPSWSFELQREGYLGTPQAPHAEAILYTPPRAALSLQTPAAVIAATCAAVLIGLLVIVVGAVAISAWFERRRAVY